MRLRRRTSPPRSRSIRPRRMASTPIIVRVIARKPPRTAGTRCRPGSRGTTCSADIAPHGMRKARDVAPRAFCHETCRLTALAANLNRPDPPSPPREDAPLHDVAAAIVIVVIVVGVVRIIPVVVIESGAKEATDEEAAAMMEAMAKPAVAPIASCKAIAGKVVSSKAIAWNRSDATTGCGPSEAIGGCRGKASRTEIPTAKPASMSAKSAATESASVTASEATTAEAPSVRASKATATAEATSAAVSATTSTASAAVQGHIRRQCDHRCHRAQRDHRFTQHHILLPVTTLLAREYAFVVSRVPYCFRRPR